MEEWRDDNFWDAALAFTSCLLSYPPEASRAKWSYLPQDHALVCTFFPFIHIRKVEWNYISLLKKERKKEKNKTGTFFFHIDCQPEVALGPRRPPVSGSVTVPSGSVEAKINSLLCPPKIFLIKGYHCFFKSIKSHQLLQSPFLQMLAVRSSDTNALPIRSRGRL